jgi:D-alanyl-D-alanine carboxypeptidase
VTTPDEAGPSLVASAAAEDESYVAVILGAREDRFGASIRALEHGFATYDRVELVVEGEQYARADVPYGRGETVALAAEESVDGLLDGGSDVEREVRARRGRGQGRRGAGRGEPARGPQGLRRGLVVGAGVVYSRGAWKEVREEEGP